MGQHRRRRRRRRRRTKSLKERGGRCGDDAAMLARSKKSIGGNKDGEGNSPAGTSRPGGECAVFRCKCTRRTALMRLMRGGARGGARGCAHLRLGHVGSAGPRGRRLQRRGCAGFASQPDSRLLLDCPFPIPLRVMYACTYIRVSRPRHEASISTPPRTSPPGRAALGNASISLVIRASTFAAAPRLRVLSLSPVLFAARG